MPETLDQIPTPETIFEEPWQAEAFATTLHLSQQGAFTWSQWVGTFAKRIAAEPRRAGEDVPTAYYRQWLGALESLVEDTFEMPLATVEIRQEQWRRAYLETPHGQPVTLANAARYHDHDHDHHQHGRGRPIAISAATRTVFDMSSP